ncbi:class I SAM-dependent methyltransferase [Streptomyces sp. NPDC053367]|uniref:class I SAM-dependent methyltransferase n=1 Tax=Streptomyces sp. NPDC053367 TaxID=3365700 RepID=UPI0037D5724D
MTTSTADLWHHYGRARATSDRTVPGTFKWSWSQDTGPGPEALGDLTGRCVGDLGAGTARHAAHLATHHQPAQVVAVDASPAQHAMATDLYAHLAPRLRIVRSCAVPHLHAMTGMYDVLYSVFGAVDFTDPRELLPAAAAALGPGGRLVFATLAHHLNGAPAHPDAVAADIPARTPAGEATTMRRWVLQEPVWTKLLDEAGFADITIDVLPAVTGGPRTADTLLVSAHHPSWNRAGSASDLRRPRATRRGRRS